MINEKIKICNFSSRDITANILLDFPPIFYAYIIYRVKGYKQCLLTSLISKINILQSKL